jgi:putative transport protein
MFESEPILTLLRGQPVLTLFTILGLGYLIGNLRIGSFSLGPVAGVLFVGLCLGHHGFRMDSGAQAVGFALFIFSVGYQAGPRFFDVLMTDGLRYFALAVVIALAGFGMATLLTVQLDLEPGSAAGLLAGGLTSSPTLAAAQEALRGGAIAPPDGWSVEDVIGNVTTSYAITYIFGLAGLILIVKLLPGIVGIDLVEEAKRLEANAPESERPVVREVSTRTFRIRDEEVTRMSAQELRDRYWDRFSVTRVRRDGHLTRMQPEEHPRLGDEILVLGDAEFFAGGITDLGEEIVDSGHNFADRDTADIVVMYGGVTGKTLAELNPADRFGVVVTRIRRMRIDIARSADFQLRKGDILTVTGPAEAIDRMGKEVGPVERDVAETDMVTFSLGIGAGVLLGLISLRVGAVSVGLGSAGGLLAAGLVIGLLHSIRPTFGRLPDAARWIFMEFGLLLFMAGVGLRAGGGIVESFLEAGPVLVVAGILVTTVPICVGYLFGRKVLGLNPVLLLGAVTGAMTSGAALSVVTKEASSSVPALGYTGSYAFANVLLTIAGSLILLF